jgi:hypothetical protein
VATASEIAYVRELINEPDENGAWSDDRISEFIEQNRNSDGTVNLKLPASDIWGVKAVAFSQLVDVSESGSSRKMSQLFENALKLQKSLKDGAETPPEVVDPLADRPYSRAITRA